MVLWQYCFNTVPHSTVKNIILDIINLVMYWTGTIKEEEEQHRQEWLPTELDSIPLQEWDPVAEQITPSESS